MVPKFGTLPRMCYGIQLLFKSQLLSYPQMLKGTGNPYFLNLTIIKLLALETLWIHLLTCLF